MELTSSHGGNAGMGMRRDDEVKSSGIRRL